MACCLGLMACVGGARAQAVPVPLMDAEDISAQLRGDETLESRLDADLDRDGETDTVFVAQGSRARSVRVMLAYRDDAGGGHRLAGRMALPNDPLVAADLGFADGELRIGDMTGADTAIQANYCFRFDRKARTFHLVGLDAARYSRRRLHDSVRMNWDPVHGPLTLSFGKPGNGPGSEEGYRYDDVRRRMRKAPALTMERTPTAEQALADAGVRLGQGVDRDR